MAEQQPDADAVAALERLEWWADARRSRQRDLGPGKRPPYLMVELEDLERVLTLARRALGFGRRERD